MRSILRYAQRALPRSQARSLHTTTTIGSLHSLYDPLQHAERLLKLSREVPSDEKIALAADVERITDLAQQQYGIDPEKLEPVVVVSVEHPVQRCTKAPRKRCGLRCTTTAAACMDDAHCRSVAP